jgi:hypothetical protein
MNEKKQEKLNYTGETRKINVNDGGKVQVVGQEVNHPPARKAPTDKEGGK